jgi:hypothetical protein
MTRSATNGCCLCKVPLAWLSPTVDEVRLGPGDWLLIPAHQKHRVAWTDPEAETVWLAVHYSRQ